MTFHWSFPYCPEQFGDSVDWQGIRDHFTWIREMEGIPQDPVYHAEGDVETHTRMVVEALARHQEWGAMGSVERTILFAAALLHDVGKPSCTRVDVDGHISSHGHARIGAMMAREILWNDAWPNGPVPFYIRERIVSLVRFHGLPLWFLDRPDPQREIYAASQRVRLDWVALLAEADVRGRICADQEELLTRIELFREYCREQGCLTCPRSFPSDHARFRYFHHLQRDPNYKPYEEPQFEVVMMAGLPGAGKDTWLTQYLPHRPVVSLDQIRRERKISPSLPQGEVIQIAKGKARELMRERCSFVWNATNTTKQIRSSLINLFASYNARVRIVYLEAPSSEILRRNRKRAESVPEGVIRKLMNKLEIPDLTEAHQVEWIIKTGDSNKIDEYRQAGAETIP